MAGRKAGRDAPAWWADPATWAKPDADPARPTENAALGRVLAAAKRATAAPKVRSRAEILDEFGAELVREVLREARLAQAAVDSRLE